MADLDQYFEELFGNPELERSMRENLFSEQYRISSGEELQHCIDDVIRNSSEENWERVIEIGEQTLQQIFDNPYFYFFVGSAYLLRIIGPGGFGRKLALSIAERPDTDLDKALQYLKKTTELNPEESVFYFPLGLAYKENSQFDQAVSCFQRVMNDIPLALEELSDIYYNERDYPNAVKYLNLVLKRDPANLKALRNLAYVHETNDNPDQAIATLEKAISAHPTNAEFYRSLSLVYKEINDLAKAESYAAKWMEFDVELKDIPRTPENIRKLLAAPY